MEELADIQKENVMEDLERGLLNYKVVEGCYNLRYKYYSQKLNLRLD